jgi:translation initiation factor 3 subunit A
MGFRSLSFSPFVFQCKFSNITFQLQVRVNVVSLASPHLQELYTWLEVEFHPLQLCSRVHSAIEELRADESSPLQQYVPALQDVTLVRLIRQISQVYQTIEIARLLELARFASAFHLERLLVDCVRHNDMQVTQILPFILIAIPLL